jgi:hypothetical protein
MSGRLIILPKKSYCPWNSKNVERVLRDEREHAEATEQAAKEGEKASSLDRLQALKKRKLEQSSSGENAVVQRNPQHINLFAHEEEEHQRRVDTALLDPSRKLQMQQHGVVPLYLGQSVNEDAFYLQKTGGSSERKSDHKSKYSDQREEERKKKMDPMRAFASSDNRKAKPNQLEHIQENKEDGEKKQQSSRKGRRGRDRADQRRSRFHSSHDHASTSASSEDDDSSPGRRKSRHQERSRYRKHRHSRTTSKQSDSTMDELRRRRAEREVAERRRQNEVLQDDSRNARLSGYQNQYHPGLSRK